jgi:hypothetical protein
LLLVEEVRELPACRHADVEEDELEVGLEEVIDDLHVQSKAVSADLQGLPPSWMSEVMTSDSG